MSAAPLRVVVLGVGHWHAPRYLDGLRDLGERIIGVGDADPTVVKRVAEDLSVPGDDDSLALVERLRPDVVVAMATHAAMPAQTAALLDHDIGLVLEKPLGRRAEEVEPLARTAEARGRFAAVAFINRYSHLWTELDRLRREDRLGPVIHAHFRIINGPPARYRRDGVDWMLDPASAGGGALRNLGIHGADSFHRLTGGDEVGVLGATITPAHYGEPVEAFGAAIVRSASGVIGTLEAGYTFASMASGGDAEARVMAGNASLIVRDRRVLARTLDDDTTLVLEDSPSDRLYARFLSDSLARFRRGRPPVADIADCWRAMRLVDAIYAAAGPAS